LRLCGDRSTVDLPACKAGALQPLISIWPIDGTIIHFSVTLPYIQVVVLTLGVWHFVK
jgi:hypothetical protein